MNMKIRKIIGLEKNLIQILDSLNITESKIRIGYQILSFFKIHRVTVVK
jgi:hypothetical protein